MSTPRLERPSDAGETLVELLISIMIIGISVVAILGGVLIAVNASKLDERQIQAQALLRSWGEYAIAQTTDTNFPAACTTASVLAYPASLETLPTGFVASLDHVGYWNRTDFGTKEDTDCVAGGPRRLTLRIAVTGSAYDGVDSTYDVVIRRPCAPAPERADGTLGCDP